MKTNNRISNTCHWDVVKLKNNYKKKKKKIYIYIYINNIL